MAEEVVAVTSSTTRPPYRTIVADPPWRYRTSRILTTANRPDTKPDAAAQYPTMTVAEIVEGWTGKELAVRFGLHPDTVYRIARGANWKHLPLKPRRPKPPLTIPEIVARAQARYAKRSPVPSPSPE